MAETTPAATAQRTQSGRRRVLRLAIAGLLTVAVILGAVGFTLRDEIIALLRGAHFVGGAAGPTTLRLPAGFTSSVYASGLSGPRMIAFSPDGTLFVAERSTGRIIAYPDPNHNGKTSGPVVVASGLNNDPTSIAFADGYLFVGERSRVTRFVLAPGPRATNPQVIIHDLPDSGNHVTRTVLVGPDQQLYVSIGSSCNVCDETDPHRASIWVYHLDGTGGHRYARGLRNAVGLAINPWNQQIWVTNNGRDLLGDDLPPETVYRLNDGANYGWPRCHAGDLIDPDMGHAGDCDGVEQPLVKMQAHSAPLGLAFYQGGVFPEQFQGLYVAFHGSWNRSVPTGYKVVFVPLDAHGDVVGPVRDFATGWLQSTESRTGRPVGLAVGPDGALYVSDDTAGLVYRIAYTS